MLGFYDFYDKCVPVKNDVWNFFEYAYPVKYDEKFNSVIDAIFEKWFGDVSPGETFEYFENVSDNKNLLRMSVPGFNTDNLKITFDDEKINIKGENVYRKKIDKTYKLNKKVPKKSTIKDGILEIEFDEVSEKAKMKTLSIE